jgi:hypothetical protein
MDLWVSCGVLDVCCSLEGHDIFAKTLSLNIIHIKILRNDCQASVLRGFCNVWLLPGSWSILGSRWPHRPRTVCDLQKITLGTSHLWVVATLCQYYTDFVTHDCQLRGIATSNHEVQLWQWMITGLERCRTFFNSLSIIHHSCGAYNPSSSLVCSYNFLSFDAIMLWLCIALPSDIIRQTCDLILPFISTQTFFSPVSWCAHWKLVILKNMSKLGTRDRMIATCWWWMRLISW